MKKIVLLLVATCAAAAADDVVIGHVRVGQEEVAIYKKQAACADGSGLRAARYPQGRQQDYVMGCWKPVDADRFKVTFDDGKVMMLSRRQLVPAGEQTHPGISL